MKRIYIYGASGHGLVVADIARLCGYEEIIFIDDGNKKYQSFEDIKDNNVIPIALGIGNNQIRKRIFEKVKSFGFNIATLIHPSSVISNSVNIDEGTVVMAKVVLNANAVVGKAVILNSSCVIEHECRIEDFVHISPNAVLGGNVEVKELTHVGIGSTVIQGIIIGKNCIIGSSSNVVKNIDNNKKAFGNPCKEIGNIINE